MLQRSRRCLTRGCRAPRYRSSRQTTSATATRRWDQPLAKVLAAAWRSSLISGRSTGSSWPVCSRSNRRRAADRGYLVVWTTGGWLLELPQDPHRQGQPDRPAGRRELAPMDLGLLDVEQVFLALLCLRGIPRRPSESVRAARRTPSGASPTSRPGRVRVRPGRAAGPSAHPALSPSPSLLLKVAQTSSGTATTSTTNAPLAGSTVRLGSRSANGLAGGWVAPAGLKSFHWP